MSHIFLQKAAFLEEKSWMMDLCRCSHSHWECLCKHLHLDQSSWNKYRADEHQIFQVKCLYSCNITKKNLQCLYCFLCRGHTKIHYRWQEYLEFWKLHCQDILDEAQQSNKRFVLFLMKKQASVEKRIERQTDVVRQFVEYNRTRQLAKHIKTKGNKMKNLLNDRPGRIHGWRKTLRC